MPQAYINDRKEISAWDSLKQNEESGLVGIRPFLDPD